MADRQMSLAEAFLDPRMGRNARLEALDAAIDWTALAALASRVRLVSPAGHHTRRWRC